MRRHYDSEESATASRRPWSTVYLPLCGEADMVDLKTNDIMMIQVTYSLDLLEHKMSIPSKRNGWMPLEKWPRNSRMTISSPWNRREASTYTPIRLQQTPNTQPKKGLKIFWAETTRPLQACGRLQGRLLPFNQPQNYQSYDKHRRRNVCRLSPQRVG